MSYVFISHAGDDKHRLKPLLAKLLDAGIPLWIDRPSEVGLQGHQLIMDGIAAGGIWEDEIRRALDGSALVLFFLSTESCAIERSDTLAREIEHGVQNNTLVVAKIDALDALPGRWRIRQTIDLIADVNDGIGDTPSDAFRDLVATLWRRLNVQKGGGSEKPADSARAVALRKRFRTLLPYLCDRRAQLQQFVTRVQAELDQPSGAPLHFFIVGEDNQCPDKFVEQLQTVDLPKLLLSNGRTNAVHQCLVRWPTTNDIGASAEDAKSWLDTLKFDIRERLMLPQTDDDKPIQSWLDTKPGALFLQFDIDVHEWSRGQMELLKSWMYWWTSLELAERRYPVIAIARLTYAPVLFRRITAPYRVRSVRREIERARIERTPQGNVVFLPELGNVSQSDVDLWLRQNQSLAYYDSARLGPRVRDYFSRLIGFRRREAAMLDIAQFLDELLEQHEIDIETVPIEGAYG